MSATVAREYVERLADLKQRIQSARQWATPSVIGLRTTAMRFHPMSRTRSLT